MWKGIQQVLTVSKLKIEIKSPRTAWETEHIQFSTAGLGIVNFNTGKNT